MKAKTPIKQEKREREKNAHLINFQRLALLTLTLHSIANKFPSHPFDVFFFEQKGSGDFRSEMKKPDERCSIAQFDPPISYI